MLKDLLNRLEEAEFFNKKNYYENLRKEVGSKCVYYDIPIFSTRLTTIHCSLEAFRGLYGIIPKPEGYELAVNNRGSYLITILSNLTTKEKVKWIFRKTSRLFQRRGYTIDSGKLNYCSQCILSKDNCNECGIVKYNLLDNSKSLMI